MVALGARDSGFERQCWINSFGEIFDKNQTIILQRMQTT